MNVLVYVTLQLLIFSPHRFLYGFYRLVPMIVKSCAVIRLTGANGVWSIAIKQRQKLCLIMRPYGSSQAWMCWYTSIGFWQYLCLSQCGSPTISRKSISFEQNCQMKRCWGARIRRSRCKVGKCGADLRLDRLCWWWRWFRLAGSITNLLWSLFPFCYR